MIDSGTAPLLLTAVAQQLLQVKQAVPDSVRLIAVTKRQPVDAIRAAYGLGIRDFGESQVQEAIAKQEQLQDLPDITWHLIGHLQSNKAAKAIDHFHWIHSLDSLKLARRINQLIQRHRQTNPSYPSPCLCLQVKMVSDPSKYGWTTDTLLADLDELSQLHCLNIQGIMTIPPLRQTEAETRQIFEQARRFSEQINALSLPNIHIRECSMGMSGDYPIAVAAGSTMIRLGRTLFGDRPT